MPRSTLNFHFAFSFNTRAAAKRLRPLLRGLCFFLASCELLGPQQLGAAHAAEQDRFEVRSSFAATARQAVLTIDLCGGQFDWTLGNYLAAKRIPATFFISGGFAASNPQVISFLKSRPDLFSLANHGMDHKVVSYESGPVLGISTIGEPGNLAREVLGPDAATRAQGGVLPWFRGAGAVYGRRALVDLIRLGKFPVGYSISADNGGSASLDHIQRQIATAPAGAVIIAHGNLPKRNVGSAIAAGLDAFVASGGRIISMNEAIALGVTQRLIRVN